MYKGKCKMSKTIQIDKVDDKATEELSNLTIYDDYKKSLDEINLLLDYLKQYKNNPISALELIDVDKFPELKEVANDVKSAKEFGLNSADIPDRIMASSLLNTIRSKVKALCSTKLLNTDYIKYMLVDLDHNVKLMKEREHRHETYYPDFRNNWNIPKLSAYIDKMLPQSYDKVLLYGRDFANPMSAILGVGYGIIGLIDLLNSYMNMAVDRYLAICNDVKTSMEKVVDPTITSSIVVTISNDKNIRLDKPFSNERVLKYLKTYDKDYKIETPTAAIKLFIEDILKTLPHKFYGLYNNYLKLANAGMLGKDNDIIVSLKNIYVNYAKPYGEDKLLEEDYNKGVYFFRSHVNLLLEAHEELIKIILLIGKYIRSVAITIHKIYQTSINIAVLTQ